MANMLDAIIIVTGGMFQIPAVEEARKLGLKTIVTDGKKNAMCSSLADDFYVIDIYDIPKHLELIKKIKTKYNIKGVFTEGSEATITVAEVAKFLHLKGISPESAKKCKDKILTRQLLEKAKIPIPKWKEVKKNTILNEARKIGFPIIIKSSNNSGSRGSTKLSNEKGLNTAYNLAKKNSTTGKVLIEEFLEGEEQSVEIFFDENKKCTFLNIVDRFFSDGKWSIELGHVNPTKIRQKTELELFNLTKKSSYVMNVNFGVFKADTIITKNGPKILEVTPRLSGGFDSQYLVPAATGKNVLKAAILISLGKPFPKNLLIDKKHKVGVTSSVWPNPGKISSIKGLDKAKKISGYENIFFRYTKGDIVEPYVDSTKRVCCIIATGRTINEAKKSLDKIKIIPIK